MESLGPMGLSCWCGEHLPFNVCEDHHRARPPLEVQSPKIMRLNHGLQRHK